MVDSFEWKQMENTRLMTWSGTMMSVSTFPPGPLPMFTILPHAFISAGEADNRNKQIRRAGVQLIALVEMNCVRFLKCMAKSWLTCGPRTGTRNEAVGYAGSLTMEQTNQINRSHARVK